MNSCATIIRLCRHVLPTGRRCLQPAVRRRSCCRHHLDAQARLHNMARARRCSSFPRICVPMNRHDLARNHAEVRRVVDTGNLDFATARMMFWALYLTRLPSQLSPVIAPASKSELLTPMESMMYL